MRVNMRSNRNNRDNNRKNNNTKNQLFTKKFKSCPFSNKNSPKIDYKNVKLLEKYISEKGKIMPSRISFVSTAKQRLLSRAIKTARTLALISHVGKIR